MKCKSVSTAKRSAARRDLLAGPRKQGSIVALITGSECHRTAGRRERAELDGMVIGAIWRATWNNASSSRLPDEVQPRRGMSDFAARSL
jgi:hypothetical protein